MSKKNIEIVKEMTDMEEHPDWAAETMEETVTTEVVKPKWSLKKKLMIGGGVLVGLVLGGIALGASKTSTTVDEDQDDSDSDDEGDNSSEDTEDTMLVATTEET